MELKDALQNELNELTNLTKINSDLYRKKLIDRLSDTIFNMSIDPDNEKPTKLKAKVELIKVFNETIRDLESSYRENIKLKQKQSEISEEKSIDNEMLLEFMKRIITKEDKDMIKSNNNEEVIQNIGITSEETVEKELEDIIKKKNVEVLEGELKKDSKDIDIQEILK